MNRSLLFSIAPLILIAGFVSPLRAEKRISVSQLEQTVTELKASSDDEASRRLSGLQLNERLNQQRFTVLVQQLAGEKARLALRAIADQSQFLTPPASDIPPNPAPTLPEQRRIMGLVAGYVERAIPQLPNFFATRVTDHFEDTPQLQRPLQLTIPYQPLHFTSRSEAAVFYQQGREVINSGKSDAKSKAATQGLTTWGVFGPILGTVLVDAATSKLAWSHWERGSNGIAAVFDFHVPQQKSHYEINYCCVATEASTVVADVHPFRRIVPYHGSITVDPATGSVLRLAIEAELKTADPVTDAAILVEYGPVEIGGHTYTCPVRSLSRTIAQTVQVDPVFKFALANQMQPLKTSLNDVTFDRYHMFRSDMRVLTPEEANLVQQAQTSAPAVASVPESPTSANPAPPSPASAPDNSASQPEPASSAIATSPAPAASPIAPAEPAIPEISPAGPPRLADIPASSAPSTPDTGYRLRTTTRLVEVTLVAFDKKGRPITDLKPGDLELFDNGREQNITSLTQSPAEAIQPTPNSDAPTEPTFSNRPVDTASVSTSTPQQPAGNTTIFLIDSSHVAFADLTHARNEMLRFLKRLPANEPVGLYVLRAYGFQVLREPTTDHDQLAATLRNWMPTAQDLLQASNEEIRNRQQMEYVRSSKDLLAMNGNTPTGEGDVMSAPDMQRRSLGDSPEQDALGYLVWVARHVAAFKGHKSLIWVASDNVLADFSEKSPDVEKGDKHLGALSLRAREALNEAHVSIYPLDSSQLEAGVVGADLQHANVQVSPASPDLTLPGEGNQAQQEMRKAQRDINPGRLTAQMQQDTHGIQPVFRELAEATGGRALRRASDIASELNSIANDGRAAYQLSFTPDTPADGTYHHLTIKLANRRDVTLRYRTGYLYEKEPATLKERFQNAVWRPADMGEIALSATATGNTQSPSLKLNIAATDLALAQQAGLWMDKLDIFLVQRDDAMLHAKLDGQTLGLRLKPSTYEKVLKDGITVDEPVKSLPQSGALRIIVVDENTGRIGTLTVPASVFKELK